MTILDATSNAAPTCHGGLENLEEEFDYWVDSQTEIEGAVPSDLRGTFLRNGPGRQQIGGQPFGHWFDGDGMLSAFSFLDGDVFFKNRYVRTPKYIEETEAQRILYRGFGTMIPGGIKANVGRYPANPANTSVIYHGDHLLACNEGGRPWKVRADTLETVGEFNFDGQLGRSNVFSAHAKLHRTTGDLINFGPGFGGVGRKGPKAVINIYRIDPTGTLTKKGKLPLEGSPFAHDFVITDRYAIFFINSIVFANMGSFFLGRTSISDQIGFDDTLPMRVEVVDLDTFESVRSFETDPGAIIHFGNAFEADDEIVIDGMHAGDFEANKVLTDVFGGGRFNGGRYHRFRLNMKTGDLSRGEISEHESEFPVFNPSMQGQPNNVTYTITSTPNGADSYFNGFQRVEFEGGIQQVTLAPGYYASEPMLAPRIDSSGEDDGYVLMVVYDAFNHRSELRISRADDIADHVATVRLRHHLPHQFHGMWYPELLLNEAKYRG